MELRLRHAASLLRDPEIKIINLVEQCGFSHRGFFTTCFKRRFGTSPGQWRKAAAQSEGNPSGRLDANSDCSFGSTILGSSASSNGSNAEPYWARKAVPSRLFTAVKALNPLKSESLPSRERSFDTLPGDRPAHSEMRLMSAAPASKRHRVAVGDR